jgi:hypothetical protein
MTTKPTVRAPLREVGHTYAEPAADPDELTAA